MTGKEIRDRRKELKLSAEQLADQLEIKLDNLYKWEKGTKITDVGAYIKLENWLKGENVPVSKKDATVSDFKADYGQDFSERVIADLAASNKAYGLAEQDRAHAAVIREQNNRDMLALLTKQSEAISKEVGQFVNETVGNFQALRAAISALQGVVIAQLPKAEQPKIRKTLESHAALILNKGNALQAQSRKEKNIHDGSNR